MSSRCRRLRELLAREAPTRSFGAHDVFSALLIEQAGIETVFLGGFGTSASLLGLPDLNFLTQTEMADAVARTTARLSIPVIADGDTGHGDLPQVARTVQLFEQAGAAGILIEDQVAPKRCGHFEQKQVVEPEVMLGRLRAALQARENPEFVIIARTDARAIEGLDAAIERANRYGEAGADVVFVEAPESLTELERLGAEVQYPQLANMLTGGKTPILAVDELGQLGFKLVVCPVESLLVCAAALRKLIAELQTKGRVDGLAEMLSFTEIKQVLGVDHYLGVGRE